MAKAGTSALIALVTTLVVGCGGDSTGPSLDSIVGTWTVARAEVSSVANPATNTELVALGLTATLVLNANNTFVLTSQFAGDPADVGTGSFTYTDGRLTLNTTSSIPPETLEFDVAISGNTMTLTGGSFSYDFGAGEEPATLDLTLTRS